MSSATPAISVIIPTYNWSAALRCAIRSVLLQTMQDFEVVVVGDGCTDDSEEVVRSFGDSRLRWFNLERNYGSQWAANNHGVRAARSEVIAYLGHDDIWYRTHLESILREVRERKADVVTSVVAIHGPPSSGVLGVAGVFATGEYSPKDFVPPSAFAHAKSLFTDGIEWQDPNDITLPIDVVFMKRMIEAGSAIASTGELTCFKFNAAWRRDVYVTKNIDDQVRMLARLETGVDFRQTELLEIIQAAVADRFIRVVVTEPGPGARKGEVAEFNRKQKGVRRRFDPAQLVTLKRAIRFDMRDQDMPFEWHVLEQRRFGGSFRWTGPSRTATIDLPIRFERDLGVRIALGWPLKREIVDSIRLSIHGRTLVHRIVKQNRRGLEIGTEICRDDIPEAIRDFGVTITVGEAVRPCDLGPSADTRTLGVPVRWIEVRPLRR